MIIYGIHRNSVFLIAANSQFIGLLWTNFIFGVLSCVRQILVKMMLAVNNFTKASGFSRAVKTKVMISNKIYCDRA